MAKQQKLEHFSHKHRLTLVETGEGKVTEESNSEFSSLRCYGCTEEIISGDAYYRCEEYCTLFCLHQSCAHLPMTIKRYHNYRCDDGLQLNKYPQKGHIRRCDDCDKPCFRFSYVCSNCDLVVDIRCALRGPITTARDYESDRMELLEERFMQKRNRLKRPFRHDHPLILVRKALETTTDSIAEEEDCYACGENITSIPYYTCETCKTYHLHILCADLPENIELHEMHPSCILVRMDVKLSTQLEARCSVCRAECNRFAFCCLQCKFVVDIICTLQAITLNESFHQHPLVQSLTKGPFRCYACDKNSEGISYKCNTCRFWVHKQCASLPSVKETSSHDHRHNIKLTYSIPETFSQMDIYCQICGKYMKHHNWAYHCYRCRYFTHVYDCSNPHRNGNEHTIANAIPLPMSDELISDKKVTNGATINHHHHPMILFADQFESNSIDVTLLFVNLLRGSATWPTFNIDGKEYSGYTFSFYRGKLFMQLTSVDLPHFIKHEGHPHVLKSTLFNTSSCCNACEQLFFGRGFRCTICAFTMDTYCALLPRTTRHRYDEHLFPLTYSAIEDVEEYVCEICEEDIIPTWFYHCEVCDQSIHGRCIWKAYFGYGRFYEFNFQGEPVILVPPSKDLPQCIICHKKDTFGHGFAFISQWNHSMVHLTCTSEDEIEVIQNEEKAPLRRTSLFHRH